MLAEIKAATDGLGAEFVFQCTGVPAAHANALKMVRRGGGFCEVGFFLDGGNAPINPHFDFCNKEISLVGSWVYTPQDYPNTFDFLRRAKAIGLPVEQLVTHHFLLKDIDAALKANVSMAGIKIDKSLPFPHFSAKRADFYLWRFYVFLSDFRNSAKRTWLLPQIPA